MALNQNIRYTNVGPSDNPRGLYDFIKPMRKIKGSGAPAPELGEDYWEYLDEVSGIDYIKNDGVWEPYADFGGFAPPIPDPLTVDQLNVNTIRGNAGENVEVDLGAAGHLQTLGGRIQVGLVGSEDNVKIESNGNVLAGSLVRGAFLSALSGGDEARLETVAGRMTLHSTSGNIDIATDTASTFVRLKPGAGGQVQATENINMLENDIINCNSVKSSVSNTMTLEHTVAGEDVEIKAEATGAGNAVLRPGATGQGQVIGDLSLQGNKLLDVTAINNGDALSYYANLSVNPSGTLQYSRHNVAQTFTWLQVGADTAGTYGNIGFNGTVNPADVPCVYIPWSARLNMVSAVLHYSGAWTFGSGTASIQVGYISTGQATIDANFVTLATLAIPTGSNFYQYSTSQLDFSLSTKKLAARLVVSGASSTSNTAELSCTVFIS